MYIFQSVQSEFLYMLSTNRWNVTIKKVWPLRLLVKEICTCFFVKISTCFSMKIELVFLRYEICVSFFVEFFTCFSMKFSFVGFMKFRFFAITLKKYVRYEDEPKCENGENRVVYTVLGSIWSLLVC